MVAVIKQERIHTPRALVVDDSRIARYVLHGLLDTLGFEVDLADSAELALERLAAGLPDIVFMDHLLPGMDGLECVRRLRNKRECDGLPIVMYTSQETATFAAEAKRAGADDVFFKTAGKEQLDGILHRLDLLPESQAAAPRAAPAKVVPIPERQRQAPQAANERGESLSRSELLAAMEPLVEAQHEKLRKDLLGEFVILERYEERMRTDLFGRIEQLTRRFAANVADTLEAQQEEARRLARRRAFFSGALATCLTLMLAASLLLGWQTHRTNDALAAGNRTAATALETGNAGLADLQAGLDALRADISALAAVAGTGAAAAAAPGSAPAPDAATALIRELQSMGILGQVRIETSAGAFCVRATARGFAMEPAGPALASCEVLPVYMASNGS